MVPIPTLRRTYILTDSFFIRPEFAINLHTLASFASSHVTHGKETETQMVWPHLKILWHGEDNSARDSERSKKERKTEKEMGR